MQALESLTDSQVGEVSGVRIREVSYPPPPPHTHSNCQKGNSLFNLAANYTLFNV